VMAGVNVTQAKTSPFGQYVLSQMQTGDTKMQELTTLTGFDPRQDVNELLLASNLTQNAGKGQNTGLALATGTFNTATIMAFATQQGAVSETYKNVTILEDPKQTHGVAFLSGSLVAAGDIGSVKAAIDRQASPSILPAGLAVQVKQLSETEDAWALTTVPPSSLKPPSTAPAVPGVGNGAQNALGTIQSASGGVKFGSNVVLTVQAQTDTAQNATTVAGMLQFLANMAQLQTAKNPQAAALAQAVTVSASGSTVSITLTLPEDQFQQLVTPKSGGARPQRAGRK